MLRFAMMFAALLFTAAGTFAQGLVKYDQHALVEFEWSTRLGIT